MTLDPFLVNMLADYPEMPHDVVDYPAFRARLREGADAMTAAVSEPAPEVREIRDIRIPVEGGEIELRIYYPFASGALPIHLYLHGGGFVSGSIHDPISDVIARVRAVGAKCIVVLVGYRLAPEHKFPTPVDDCYAALSWVAVNAAEIGGDSELITIGGNSAGGTLTAAVCLKARAEGGPSAALQLLEVPALDLRFQTESAGLFGHGYALSNRDLAVSRRDYLRDAADLLNPIASPLLATDLTGLPPAHIMVAEYDVLRDDGIDYASRLTEAGVPAMLTVGEGHVHISMFLTGVLEIARRWRDETIDVLLRIHAGEPLQTGASLPIQTL